MKTRLFLIALAALLYLPQNSQAFNAQRLRPHVGTVSGFHLFTSENLQPGAFSFGLNLNYTRNPLEAGTPTTNPRQVGIVDQFFTGHALFGFGVAKRLNVFLDVPFNFYHDIAPVFIANRDRSGMDMGDLQFSGHLQIFDVNETKNKWGLALVGHVSAPTGDTSIYFGDDGVSGGFKLVLDKKVASNHFFANVGAHFRPEETLRNLVIDDEFTYGLGFQRPLSAKHALNIILEAEGAIKFKRFFEEEETAPLETHAVLQKKWLKDRSLTTHIGGSYGWTAGWGTPDYRIHGGIAYNFPLNQKKRAPKKVKEELFVFQTVHFPFDSSRYYKKHNTYLDKVAAYYQKKPRTKMVIRGHTDSKGSPEYNQKLSMRRSKRVFDALVARGVSPDNMRIEVLGENEPQAENETGQGRHLNRRVEILFQK